MNKQSNEPGRFVGIDWAEQKHDCYVIDRDGNRTSPATLVVAVGSTVT